MADLETNDIPQKQKSPKSPIVVLVLGAIFLFWLLMLFMSKDFYDEFGMEISRDMWVFIGSAIMIVLIIILLVAGFPAKAPIPTSTQSQFTSIAPATIPQPKQGVVISEVPPTAEMQGSAVMDSEPLVVEAEIVEVEAIEVEEEPDTRSSLRMQKPKLVEYPKKVPGGVYGDTIIRVDPLTKLNLRTLLVRSCMICDRQGKCWDEFMESVPRDEFLDNIDCKRGLRKIRGGPSDEEPKMLKRRVKKQTTTS